MHARYGWRSRRTRNPPPTAAFSNSYRSTGHAPTAFKFTQLRSNAVVRWEYRPGSTLFVVWQHGRQDATNQNPNQSWAKDYGDLFALHPDNTFLVKMAYWFNR